jgi:hypothetical protein
MRQDLYLQPSYSPFLVLHWMHTLTAIRLIDVIPVAQTRPRDPAEINSASIFDAFGPAFDYVTDWKTLESGDMTCCR